jgi:hypothetical protein
MLLDVDGILLVFKLVLEFPEGIAGSCMLVKDDDRLPYARFPLCLLEPIVNDHAVSVAFESSHS